MSIAALYLLNVFLTLLSYLLSFLPFLYSQLYLVYLHHSCTSYIHTFKAP